MIARALRTAEGTSTAAFGATEWGLLLVAASVWGASFVLIAEGLETFEPGLISWLRLAFGAGTLALFPTARSPVDRADWPVVVLLAVAWMAVPFLLFPIAQQWISSSLAGMINGATPLFAAWFAAALLRRLPGRVQAAGLLIGFAGVVLLALPADEAEASVAGVALALVATGCYGLAFNVAVPLQQRYGALPILLRALVAALALTTPLGVVSLPASSWSVSSLAAVGALGVGGTALAYVAMTTLVGRSGATRGAIAVYFIPVVAVMLGVGIRHETVAVLGLAGMGLVLVGAYLTSRRDAPRRSPLPSGD